MYLKYSTKVKVGMSIFAATICSVVILALAIGMNMDSETTDYKFMFYDESVNGLSTGSVI